MNLLFELVTAVLRGLAKAALIAMAAVFVLGVLCIGLLIAVAHVIRYLLTGRRPALFTTFTRFNQAAQQYRPGNWAGTAAGTRQDSGDIVDVQAHEVRAVLGAPAPSKPAD